MIVKKASVKFSTTGKVDIVDITERVSGIVDDSDVSDGILNVFVPGATGALTTIECESGLLEDFKDFLEKIIPRGADYKHNLSHADRNGHSHVRASLIGPSITAPVRNGKVVLGIWQHIVFIEMDNRPRQRSLVVTVIGHGKTSGRS
ncbi:MAG: YjbQ family protein [Elusimicrobia bacterium]|nr:YjbQ family protein [Elusimicrobiota bacterium]